MIDTKVKTKSVTNTQLVVATLAAFMAGGLAFAAAPAQNRVAAAPKCGVNSYSVLNFGKGCASGNYTGIDVACYDGTQVQHRPGVCTPLAQLKNFATQTCANRCSRPPQVANGTLRVRTFNDMQTDRDTQNFTLGEGEAGNLVIDLTAGPEEGLNVRDLEFDVIGGAYYSYDDPANPELQRTDFFDLQNLTFNLYSDSRHQNLLNRAVVIPPINNNDGTRGRIQFSNLNFALRAGESRNLYLGIDSLSQSTSTILSFDFPTIRATGVASGADIAGLVSPQQGAGWPSFEFLPVQLVVGSNFPNGRLIWGHQNLFQFTMAATENSNASNGDSTSAFLENLLLVLNKDAETEINNLELCRTQLGVCIPLEITSTSPRGELILSNTQGYRISFEDIDDANRPFFEEILPGLAPYEFTLRGTVQPSENGFVQARILDGNALGGIYYSFDTTNNGIEDRILPYTPNNFRFENRDIVGGILVNN